MQDGIADHRILVISGNPQSRSRLKTLLSQHGAVVDEAATAASGLEAARHFPDLILIAIRLPDGNGVDVAERLRSDPASRDIPIVHLSAIAAGDDMLVDSLAAGANTLLFEPITDEVLLSTARSMLRFRNTQRQLETAFSFEASGAFDWRIEFDEFIWAKTLQVMHGIDPDSFGGTLESFLGIVHPNDRSLVEQAFTLTSIQADSDEIDVKFRTMQRRGSGWLECRGTALRDQSGTPVRLLGVMFDVTDRETDRERIDQMRRVAERLSMARTPTLVLGIARRELGLIGFSCRVVDRSTTTSSPDIHIVNVGDSSIELRALDPGNETSSSLKQATAVAQIVGSALERALQFESERANAEALQRALLPSKFPPIPGWRVDVEYEPAVSQDRLGGDFYDLILLDHRFVAVVGDVAGHGIQATQQMGVIRNMLRTLVVQADGDPARVIEEAADLAVKVGGRDRPFVTSVVATIELADGSVRIASAGHPPPLLWTRGSFSVVDVKPRPPLGVPLDVPATVTTVKLAPNEGLAFYTDGVFERRDVPMLEGIRLATTDDVPDFTARRILELGDHDVLNVDDRAVLLTQRLEEDLD